MYSSLRGDGRVEEIQPVDLIESGKDCFDPSMRQMSLRAGGASNGSRFVSGVVDLYEAAAVAMSVFSSILNGDLASSLSYFFPDIGGHIHIAPLKDPKRAEEKARDDYGARKDGPGESWLYDVVRGMVECDTQEEVCAVIAALHALSLSSPRVQVIRLKNRFKSPTPSGFRDVNLNLRIEIASNVFHICELQVHLKAIYEFDKVHQSHHHYEYFRSYFRGSIESVKARLELFRQFDRDADAEIQEDGAAFLLQVIDRALSLRDEGRLSGLEDLLKTINEYELCESVSRCLLQVQGERWGEFSLLTLDSAHDLGVLFVDLGKHEEACLMFQRALVGYQKTLGPESTSSLMAINSIAGVLSNQGRNEEAYILYQKVLVGREKTLGPNHQRLAIYCSSFPSCFQLHSLIFPFSFSLAH